MRRRKKVTKKKINAIKCEADGIKFQSQLELTFYTLLKEAGIKFDYEGVTYELQEESYYNGICLERKQARSKEMVQSVKIREVTYTPDFIGENEEWIVECKGYPIQPFPLKWKMFKEKMSLRENPPILFKPVTKADCEQVVEYLKKKGYGKIEI